ncbi:hypothetical protein L9F63_013926 [Diploptera punctata]|uniref:Acyltransferase 3 domain-containing protein n=1 Tax=Diploptera punctata TaxID=6984 RepID=A0AAD8A9W3_DIPPU|nr:hypothetical protein L9F63_013926 [Diploptera punctata]
MVAMLCLIGTIHSLLVQDSEKQNKWLSAFSWYNNGKSLISTKLNADSLPVLHGIRFLSIAWVVMAHSYEYAANLPQLNYLDADTAIRTWKYLALMNSPFAVDTFMVLSGLLLGYVFMKSMEKGVHFNLPMFYLHRILRVWPVLGIIVLFHSTLITKLGDGLLWKYVIINEQSKLCKENWWSTLLFVNNYVHVKKMCFPVSWFLSADMQLYWISPIFLFLLLKKPRFGIGAIMGGIFIGIGINFQQSYYYQDNASIIATRGATNDRYYYTHTRYVAWLIGLLCGYIIYKTTDWRNRVAAGRDQLSKRFVIGGWTYSTVACTAVIHWIYPLQQVNHEYNVIEHSLYLSLSHPLWASGISWIIFACISGYGGFINTLLTWKAMIPLSHLTYCVYLLHFVVLCVVMANTKTSGYVNDAEMVC